MASPSVKSSLHPTLLTEKRVALTSASEHLVIIRAQGKLLRVFVDNITVPLLEATDGDIASGAIGTFQGGQGVMLQSVPTEVSGVYGAMIVLSTAVNVTIPFPSIVPSEERRLYVPAGAYVSPVLMLEGARDALLDAIHGLSVRVIERNHEACGWHGLMFVACCSACLAISSALACFSSRMARVWVSLA